MCLTTYQKWPKIAWKPITTYKVVYGYEDPYKTMYQRVKIQIGKTYKESVYNILKNRYSFMVIEEDKKVYNFNQGLHSCTEKDNAKDIAEYFNVLYPTNIVECIIPRFSLYWIEDCNDIVSNKLKYVKILKQ